MIEWFIKFTIIWASISTVIFATGWYLVTTIKPRFPDWWQQELVDDEPEFRKIYHQDPR